MSIAGTAAYADLEDLPPLVDAAVRLARESGFAYSCLPEQGGLLRLLARGVREGGVIGETGTGCGVGLAWLAEGARAGTRLVSVERDADRAARAAALFDGRPEVEVLSGDWCSLREYGPFDLLVLDGGGQGKGEAAAEAADPAGWLRPGGLLVMDDFSPLTQWPPLFQGRVDDARVHWLTHPSLRATQINVTPEASTLLATFPLPSTP